MAGNADVTATLRLRAKDESAKAFRSLSGRFDQVDKKARQVERATQATMRAERAAGRVAAVNRTAARTEAAFLARAGGVLAPAALAYGAGRAFKQFAGVERELTRIGLKAGATQDQMRLVRNEIEQVGHKWAVPIADVTETFDTLIESGFEFDQARRQLSDMVKVTQALGGAGADTVQTWDALRKNLGASEGEFMAYFDAIAAGGAAGKFEASDIAQYLPVLAPSAAKMGINSLEDFQGLIGVLEALRDVSGDSSQTVTSMSDFLEKLTSPAVVKAFKGADIDMFKELDKAEESGEDLWNTMHRLMMAATGGDARRLGEFFGDKEARRMATLLLTDLDRVLASIEKVKAAGRGTIDINVNAVTANSQAKIDRLSNSIDALITEGGAGLSKWLNDPLESVGDALARGNAFDAGLERLAQEGTSKGKARDEFNQRYGQAHPDFEWWSPKDHRARANAFVQGVQAYGRGEIAEPQDYVLKQLVDRSRAGEETILKASDLPIDPTSDLGFSTGTIAKPTWRPDPSAPSPLTPEGSISAPSLVYPDEAPRIFTNKDLAQARIDWMPADRVAAAMDEASGPVRVTVDNLDALAASAPDWTGWTQPEPITIPDYTTPGSSGWTGGSFDESRFGGETLAVEGIDELRQAMEAGGYSVAQGGRDAEAAIDRGGDQLPEMGQRAGTAVQSGGSAAGEAITQSARALHSAGDYVAQQIRAALRTPVNVKVDAPSGGALIGGMAGGATRPAAKSMPDAGVAGGQ